MYRYFLFLAMIFFPSVIMAAGGDSDFEQSDSPTHLPAMILLDEDDDIDESISYLESLGVTVLRHRGRILLTFIPYDSEFLTGNPSGETGRKAPSGRRFKDIQFGRRNLIEPTMNKARGFYNADYIGLGRDLPQPYDGSGVVVGICDIGFDSRHPTFLDADGSESRVRRVVHYIEDRGIRNVYDDPVDILVWHTDTPDNWHATHVTGIAAGSGAGTGYRGLAPGADIVFTGSQLYDVGLLAGVEDIIEYAREAGKPAVINLSMGNYLGPHDGTSLFTQYLDLCAQDAVICLSSGNEGNNSVSMSYDFTEADPEVRVKPNDWSGVNITGVAEVWSADETPFDFFFYWNNNTTFANRKDVYPLLRADGDGQVEWSISLDPDAPDYDETLASLFYEGYVKATAGVSPLNGRYCASVEFELKTDIYHPNSKWAEWWPGIRMAGSPGSHIDIYCSGGSFLRRESGFPEPDNSQCVSDLATGLLTISVGMMNNRDLQSDPGPGFAEGDVSIYSGYGTLVDGRVLPLTVAPGGHIISSSSSAFLEKYTEELKNVADTSHHDGGDAYWMVNSGTSMSCPFVVGSIATWLQAYPHLTSEDVQEIIRSTNHSSDVPDLSDPRNGQGWFDAYRGIQRVLDLAALNVGSLDATGSALRVEGGYIYIGNPSGQPVTVEIFTPAGLAADRAVLSGTLVEYSLSHLPSGIYIVRAAGRCIKIAV